MRVWVRSVDQQRSATPERKGTLRQDGRAKSNLHVALNWTSINEGIRSATDPATRHHHVHEKSIQEEVKQGVAKPGIMQRVGCHTVCHSLATHLLEYGSDIQTVQELLAFKDVSITIYTHVLQNGAYGERSPLDQSK